MVTGDSCYIIYMKSQLFCHPDRADNEKALEADLDACLMSCVPGRVHVHVIEACFILVCCRSLTSLT